MGEMVIYSGGAAPEIANMHVLGPRVHRLEAYEHPLPGAELHISGRRGDRGSALSADHGNGPWS